MTINWHLWQRLLQLTRKLRGLIDKTPTSLVTQKMRFESARGSLTKQSQDYFTWSNLAFTEKCFVCLCRFGIFFSTKAEPVQSHQFWINQDWGCLCRAYSFLSICLSGFGFSFFKLKWNTKKRNFKFTFYCRELFLKSKNHFVLRFMSQLQSRNKNQKIKNKKQKSNLLSLLSHFNLTKNPPKNPTK